MAENSEQVEQKVDHVAEAELAVAQAGQYFGDEADQTTIAAAAIGQVHATLALVEEVRALRRSLNGLTAPDPQVGFGSEARVLKTVVR